MRTNAEDWNGAPGGRDQAVIENELREVLERMMHWHASTLDELPGDARAFDAFGWPALIRHVLALAIRSGTEILSLLHAFWLHAAPDGAAIPGGSREHYGSPHATEGGENDGDRMFSGPCHGFMRAWLEQLEAAAGQYGRPSSAGEEPASQEEVLRRLAAHPALPRREDLDRIADEQRRLKRRVSRLESRLKAAEPAGSPVSR